MAGRIRSIKPEILEDEKTAALSHLAWRLFVSLWLIADDYGNLRGDPTYVMGQALWATNESRDSVAGALGELATVGLVRPYTVRGQSYLHITGWDKHQKVTHKGKPRMPGPGEDDNSSSAQESLQRPSGEPPETLLPDLRSPISDHERERPGEPPETLAYDPDSPRARGELAEGMWSRVSAARVEIAREVGLPDPWPLPPITPSTRTRGFNDLRDRIREEGARAPAVCDHVIAMTIAGARRARSVEWLSEKLFGELAWRTARDRPADWKPPTRASPAVVRLASTSTDDDPDYSHLPK